MFCKNYIALVLCISGWFCAQAQSPSSTPTWATDVACIVYSHCTTCHNPKGIAADRLLLETYADAYAARFSIMEKVETREMPPWPPNQAYHPMAHDRSLTDDEINIINAWVNGGAPQGDPAVAPPPPVISSAWEIPAPDMSIALPTYTVPPITSDLYRSFAMPITVPPNTYITGFEVIPGNRNIVHHVLFFQDTTQQGLQLDAADPLPGYTSGGGGIGVSGARLIGGWVPGGGAKLFPEGMGMRLKPNTTIVAQLHYPTGSSGAVDSTRINLKLQTTPYMREVYSAATLDHISSIQNGPLIIPPNTVKTFYEKFTIPNGVDITVIGVGPHAHLLCTNMRSFAVTPQNDTIPLIDIPHWDFHWQGFYDFKQLVKLPGGTTLHGIATYDNTENNPHNPSSPPQWVYLGEETTDEMMLFFFGYTFYFPGDENIVIDDREHLAHYQDCEPLVLPTANVPTALPSLQLFPNPGTDVLTLRYTEPLPVQVLLKDVMGKTVTPMQTITQEGTLPVGHLCNGIYFVHLYDARTATWLRCEKVQVLR